MLEERIFALLGVQPLHVRFVAVTHQHPKGIKCKGWSEAIPFFDKRAEIRIVMQSTDACEELLKSVAANKDGKLPLAAALPDASPWGMVRFSIKPHALPQQGKSGTTQHKGTKRALEDSEHRGGGRVGADPPGRGSKPRKGATPPMHRIPPREGNNSGGDSFARLTFGNLPADALSRLQSLFGRNQTTWARSLLRHFGGLYGVTSVQFQYNNSVLQRTDRHPDRRLMSLQCITMDCRSLDEAFMLQTDVMRGGYGEGPFWRFHGNGTQQPLPSPLSVTVESLLRGGRGGVQTPGQQPGRVGLGGGQGVMGGASRRAPGVAQGSQQAVTKGGTVVPSVAQGSPASEQDREKGVVLRLDHLQSVGVGQLDWRIITADFVKAVAVELRLDERFGDFGRRVEAAESSARSMETRLQEAVTQNAKLEACMHAVVTQSARVADEVASKDERDSKRWEELQAQSARVADEVASKDARDSKRWEELQATLRVLMTGSKNDVSVMAGDVIPTTGAEYAQTRSQTRGGHAECSSVRSSQ